MRAPWFLGIVFSVITLSGCFWASPGDIGLEDGRLQPCPDSPNCVSSYEDDRHAIEPIQFQGELPKVRVQVVKLVLDHFDARVVTRTGNYVHLAVSTTLGFVDDLEFQFDSESKMIHVRSASRVGRSDLGVNRDRIQFLRERLNKSLTE